jgi:hypothetical protein
MRDLINIINESENKNLTKSKKMTLSEYIQQQDIPEERKMKLVEMASKYNFFKVSKEEKKHYDSLSFKQFVKEIYDTYGYEHIEEVAGQQMINGRGAIVDASYQTGIPTSDIMAIPYRGDYFMFDISEANGQ